jgi:hypothetical protein
MKALLVSACALSALALSAIPAWATICENDGCPVPAPLLGAGLPGLAVLAAGGAGYLAMRFFRRRQS